MTEGLIYCGVSSIVLGAILFLFRIEAGVGRRIIFPGLRARGDDAVVRLGMFGRMLGEQFGFRAVRIVLHYLMHIVLTLVIRFVRTFEKTLVRLQLRNRAVARTVRTEGEKSHLELIAEHKVEQALSPREKAHLKRQSLGQ